MKKRDRILNCTEERTATADSTKRDARRCKENLSASTVSLTDDARGRCCCCLAAMTKLEKRFTSGSKENMLRTSFPNGWPPPNVDREGWCCTTHSLRIARWVPPTMSHLQKEIKPVTAFDLIKRHRWPLVQFPHYAYD